MLPNVLVRQNENHKQHSQNIRFQIALILSMRIQSDQNDVSKLIPNMLIRPNEDPKTVKNVIPKVIPMYNNTSIYRII